MASQARSAGRDESEVYRDLRPLLFSIAYRMLGSVSEAEDVVQEAFLRYFRATSDGSTIESPKAFLSAVTTRLAIDLLRSARVRRESYVGPWLPEPLLTEVVADPAEQVADADSLSMAFLLVLERLSPVERAVFLLRDVFGYGFDEVAQIVDRSEANCRQIAVRARQHVASGRPRFDPSRATRDRLADSFFTALEGGDVEGLVSVLASDVVVNGDGGGQAPSWLRPITGRDDVLRLLRGVGEQTRQVGITFERAEVNGQPGALLRAPDGRLTNVFVLDISDGRVQVIRSVINPQKLAHLGPLADLKALSSGRRRAPGPPTTP